MDYIGKLTEQELQFICSQIPGKDFKQYYQHNPKSFNTIRPGFRATSLSDSDATKLAVQFATRSGFISDFICKRISLWMEEIQDAFEENCKTEENKPLALFMTLGGSVFCENAELYFKLQDKEYPQEFINLCSGLHRILSHSDDTSEDSSKDNASKPLDADDSSSARQESHPTDWTEKENSYLKQIADLEAELENYSVQLKDAALEISQKDESLSQQVSRLNDLERLAKASIPTPTLTCSAQYPYCSLCEVYTDWEGRQKLRRLTDIENNELLDRYSESSPTVSILYPKGAFDNGLIGVWSWKTTPKDSGGLYSESSFQHQFHVVEIIEATGCTSLAQLTEMLKAGFECELHTNSVLFSFKSGENIWNGLYCDKTQLDIRENNIRIKDNVFSLNKYIFSDSAILSINKIKYYRTFDLGMPSEIVRMNDPLEIVKAIFVQRVKWTEMKLAGFHKKEYQGARDYIESLKTADLVQEIAVACDCSDEDGKRFLEEFLHRADEYLEGADFETETMVQLVLNSEVLMSACETAIYADWEKKHQLEISNARQAKNDILLEVEQQKQHLADLKREENLTNQELSRLRDEIANQENMAASITQNVNNKIAEAGKNASAFISDLLFKLPLPQYSPAMQSNKDTATYQVGDELSEDNCDEYANYQELIDAISIELDEAGVGETYRDSLAAYLYAVYLHRVPIIVAGPNGKDIADALSATLCHNFASSLYLNGEYDKDILENLTSSSSQVIVIQNPFSSGWFSHLPDILEDRSHFYILNVPCAEELLIEPKSLFNYALPLLTEPMITKRASKNYMGGICSNQFEHYKRPHQTSEIRYNKFNTRLKMGPLVQNTYRKITTDMSALIAAEGSSFQDEVLFEMLPYAFATGNLAELFSIFNDYPDVEKSLTKDIRQLLKLYQEDV